MIHVGKKVGLHRFSASVQLLQLCLNIVYLYNINFHLGLG